MCGGASPHACLFAVHKGQQPDIDASGGLLAGNAIREIVAAGWPRPSKRAIIKRAIIKA